MDREDLAREALTRKSGLTGADHRPQGAARAAPGRGGEADPRPAAAAGEGRVLPHPQGDDQGDLHRRRGADPDQRGDVGHRRGDGRRRHGHPAGRGQDRADAGPGRRDRRADRLRRARRRQPIGGSDDITRELDAMSSEADVEAELARLKASSGAAGDRGRGRRRHHRGRAREDVGGRRADDDRPDPRRGTVRRLRRGHRPAQRAGRSRRDGDRGRRRRDVQQGAARPCSTAYAPSACRTTRTASTSPT